MAKKQVRERYKLPHAQVLYEPWTFWSHFKSKRVDSVERFTIRSIGVDGVEFITPIPPPIGQQVLVNLRLQNEPAPLVMRGVVKGIKSHREKLKEKRVWVKFTHVPKELGPTLMKIGEAIV